MSTARRAGLLIAWTGVIALLGFYVQSELKVGGDLRLFLPSPQTSAERLLLTEIGESPASRLLLLALEGAPAEVLAQSSQDLASALREDRAFGVIANGEASLEDIPEALLPYRYLLSSTLDTEPLNSSTLRRELQDRVHDLSSPAGALLEQWIPRDPTLEILKLVEAWQPSQQPQKQYGVWFGKAGQSALLLVETKAPAFDPDAQRTALDTLQRYFQQTKADPHVSLTVSGPGAFSALMKETTQREAQWLGLIATAGMVVLLVLAYRRPAYVLLGTLPIASAGVSGLAAVSAIFGSVHGITLAFGFTLIGVAQDYPMHLFSHQESGKSPLAVARNVWPTLATGVVSTCIAYLAFLQSGVTGLQQLACFTIAGLAVAALTTRYVLPHLLPANPRDCAHSPLLARIWSRVTAMPRPAWLSPGVALLCLAMIFGLPGPMWQNDLGKLTPVPLELLQKDTDLRQELGAPDIRYLLVLQGDSADAVLSGLQSLDDRLDRLVSKGVVTSYRHAAQFIPSTTIQRRRQAALPSSAQLESELRVASQGLPFKSGLFSAFLEDVEKASRLAPLTPDRLAGTPLQLSVSGLLRHHGDRWTGLVTFSGVRDRDALTQLAAKEAESVTLLDLKEASEGLVARQRTHILVSLGIAAILLMVTILVTLKSVHRMRRVVTPMILTTLIIVAALHAFGVPLTLFHLIALVLAAGLGVDYALFFEAVESDLPAQHRTLHAVLVCSLSTLMVFVLLAFSTLPVLRAIGVTVSIGVVGNFVLALLLARPSDRA